MESPNVVLLAVVRPAIVGGLTALLAEGTGVLPVEGRSPTASHQSKKYVKVEDATLSRFAAADHRRRFVRQQRVCRARAEPAAPNGQT
jgi:hypothetical protein